MSLIRLIGLIVAAALTLGAAYSLGDTSVEVLNFTLTSEVSNSTVESAVVEIAPAQPPTQIGSIVTSVKLYADGDLIGTGQVPTGPASGTEVIFDDLDVDIGESEEESVFVFPEPAALALFAAAIPLCARRRR